jgi:hypothetical protein
MFLFYWPDDEWGRLGKLKYCSMWKHDDWLIELVEQSDGYLEVYCTLSSTKLLYFEYFRIN